MLYAAIVWEENSLVDSAIFAMVVRAVHLLWKVYDAFKHPAVTLSNSRKKKN